MFGSLRSQLILHTINDTPRLYMHFFVCKQIFHMLMLICREENKKTLKCVIYIKTVIV